MFYHIHFFSLIINVFNKKKYIYIIMNYNNIHYNNKNYPIIIINIGNTYFLLGIIIK